jgi:CubicO group peptidase (beta-lactamase class C family)
MKNAPLRKSIIVTIIVLFVGCSIAPIAGRIISENKSFLFERQIGLPDNLDIDKKITLLMKLCHTPSLSTCIVKNNSVVWLNNYGIYDIKNDKDTSNDTVYLIGSISKTFTAAALLQLYDQGLFDLDDDVSKYLPFDLRNPNHPDVKITYRMLLSHQSSLAPDPRSGKLYFFFLGYPFERLADYLVPGGDLYDPKIWSSSPPGQETHYSSIAYALLGYLVEILSNQSFEQFCTEKIFSPLDMMNTSFLIDDFNSIQLAIPYIWFGLYIPLPHQNIYCSPAAGLRTTIYDFSRFLIVHMNKGLYNGVRILNESTVEMMHKIQYPNSRFGLGWMIWNSPDGEIYGGHSGVNLGGHALMKIRNSDNVGIIYLINQLNPILYSIQLIQQWAHSQLDKVLFQKADEF